MAFLSRVASSALPVRLARLYGRSLYATLLVMVFGGLAIGHATVDMDDSRSQQSLRARQWRYALVLAVQLIVSLRLVLLLLRRRLLAPLGTLMCFSDRLLRGNAEGMETVEQAAFLLRHGCRRAQGFLYGRPVGADDILDTWREEDAEYEPARFG